MIRVIVISVIVISLIFIGVIVISLIVTLNLQLLTQDPWKRQL